jgi:hypothetical protein
MSTKHSFLRVALLTLLAMLAIGSTAALVASVGSALTGPGDCSLSPPVSPDVSPPDCPPVSPPVSPPEAVPTQVTYTGPMTIVNGTSTSLTARLNQLDTTPVGGQVLVFTLGTGVGAQSCSTLTAGDGTASCAIFPVAQPRGPAALTVTFGGASHYLASSVSASPTVYTATTLTDTRPTTIANRRPATLSARLTGPGTMPVTGEPVTLTLGTGQRAQSCTGSTDANGVASCEIPMVNQPLGPNSVVANFVARDNYYGAISSVPTVVFEYTAGGTFVIGDVTAGAPTVGNTVTFWGSKWAKSNALSGSSTPRQMTGFVATRAIPACGASWTTGAGNRGPAPPHWALGHLNAGAPARVPSYTAMIVTSQVTMSRGALVGDTVHVVVVRTDAGYRPNPGATGQGTIVAVIC